MPTPMEAYRQGYEKGRSDNIAGNLAETTMGMLRDDPRGYFQQGYSDGAAGKPFNAPSVPTSSTRRRLPKFSEDPMGWLFGALIYVELWILWQLVKAPFQLVGSLMRSEKPPLSVIIRNVIVAAIAIVLIWWVPRSGRNAAASVASGPAVVNDAPIPPSTASIPTSALATAVPLLQATEWEVRWEGKERDDPLEMKLRRHGNEIEGLVIRSFPNGNIAPMVSEVRSSISTDGSLTLMSEGGLQWRGKLDGANQITGVFPNGGDPNDSRFFFPFTVVAVESLPAGTVKTKSSEGPPTTSDWDTFAKTFSDAIASQNRDALRPLIAEKFELANEGSAPFYSPDRVLARLESPKAWEELRKAIDRKFQDRPPTAWGKLRKAAMDPSPCDGCKYQVALIFVRDLAQNWHWSAWAYPGD